MNRNKPEQNEPTRGEKLVIAILAAIAFTASGAALYSFYVDGGIFGADNFILEIAASVIVICIIAVSWIINRSGRTRQGNGRK